MNTGRINEWYFTHTYDPYFGTVAQFGHDFLKLGSDTKEVGTVDFIYFHTFGNHEMFFVHFQIGFIIGVDFIFDNRYFCCFHDTFHEQYTGNEQTHFNSYGQIEDNSQEESDQQYGDV